MHPVSLLIVSCFLFSVLAVLIKFTSQLIHPIEQAFFRNILGVLLLLPFFLKQNSFVNKKTNLKLLFLRGFFGGITMILIFTSYTMIPISQAIAISFSTPLFIYFGSIFFFSETLDKQKTFLMIIGFILTIIITRPDLEVQIGTILALVSSITHAIAGLLVKKISKSESVFTLMFSLVILMTPITFIPSIFVWENPMNSLTLSLLISIAIIATFGNYFWTKAISLSKLTNLMPFDFSKLIFASILSFLFFDEKIDFVTSLCGTGLIICNTIMAKKIKNEKI